MGIAQYYQPIYLFIVSLFSLQAYAKYKKRDVPMNERQTRTLNGECFILMSLMVLFIGLRPVSSKYFGDMANYVESYDVF